MAKIDLGVTSTTSIPKRWVEIPVKDLFDYPFPTIRVNLEEYHPGERYYLDDERADWVETLIRKKQSADVRVLQKTPDLITQDIMTKNGTARGGGFVRDPDAQMK